MGQTTGAWPKGIAVGNWREGGCSAQRPQMEWMSIPFLFLLRPFPISHYYSTPVSPNPFPSPLFLSLECSYWRFPEIC